MDFIDELQNLIKNSNQLEKRSRLTDEQLDIIRLMHPIFSLIILITLK